MESSRAVLITYNHAGASRRASGIRISGNVVLTAGHSGDGSEYMVWLDGIAHEARLIWESGNEQIDLAVIQASSLPTVTPILVADLDYGQNSMVEAYSLCFPAFRRAMATIVKDGDPPKEAKGHDNVASLIGWISLSTNIVARTGDPAVENGASPLTYILDPSRSVLPSNILDASSQSSSWEGASGAGIVTTYENREYLVGLVTAKGMLESVSNLRVTPISSVHQLTTNKANDFLQILYPSSNSDTPRQTVDNLPIVRGQTIQTASHDVGVDRVSLAVHSTYMTHVQQLAPDILRDRAGEMLEIEEFAGRVDSDSSSYLYWRGDPFAGKTAIMASFVCRDHSAFDTVAFFVTGRIVSQSDSYSFAEAMIEQLSALLRKDLPILVGESSRARYFIELLEMALVQAASSERNLLLLIDGVDEDSGWKDGARDSILSLLPRQSRAHLRVVLAGRNNPTFPFDLPSDHAVRTCPTRVVNQSPYVRDLEVAGQEELNTILRGGELAQRVICTLIAAQDHLTLRDLEELTGSAPFELLGILAGASGRALHVAARDGDLDRGESAYAFAHETLVEAAIQSVGQKRIQECVERLQTWCHGYAGSGWPTNTPWYLLVAYQDALMRSGDLDGAFELVTSTARINELTRRTRSDSRALSQIDSVASMIDANSGDFTRQALLAFQRDRIVARSSRLPVSVPIALMCVGDLDRAQALIAALGRTERAEYWAMIAQSVTGLRISEELAQNMLGMALGNLVGNAADPLLKPFLFGLLRGFVQEGQQGHAVSVARRLCMLSSVSDDPLQMFARVVCELGRVDLTQALDMVGALGGNDHQRIDILVYAAEYSLREERPYQGLQFAQRAGELTLASHGSDRRAKRVIDCFRDLVAGEVDYADVTGEAVDTLRCLARILKAWRSDCNYDPGLPERAVSLIKQVEWPPKTAIQDIRLANGAMLSEMGDRALTFALTGHPDVAMDLALTAVEACTSVGDAEVHDFVLAEAAIGLTSCGRAAEAVQLVDGIADPYRKWFAALQIDFECLFLSTRELPISLDSLGRPEASPIWGASPSNLGEASLLMGFGFPYSQCAGLVDMLAVSGLRAQANAYCSIGRWLSGAREDAERLARDAERDAERAADEGERAWCAAYARLAYSVLGLGAEVERLGPMNLIRTARVGMPWLTLRPEINDASLGVFLSRWARADQARILEMFGGMLKWRTGPSPAVVESVDLAMHQPEFLAMMLGRIRDPSRRAEAEQRIRGNKRRSGDQEWAVDAQSDEDGASNSTSRRLGGMSEGDRDTANFVVGVSRLGGASCLEKVWKLMDADRFDTLEVAVRELARGGYEKLTADGLSLMKSLAEMDPLSADWRIRNTRRLETLSWIRDPDLEGEFRRVWSMLPWRYTVRALSVARPDTMVHLVRKVLNVSARD
jgi:hypothetical protein